MFKRFLEIVSASIFSAMISAGITTMALADNFVPKADYYNLVEQINKQEVIEMVATEEPPQVTDIVLAVDIPEPEPTPVVESYSLTQEEIDLIALVVMAEAEGEPEEGKRLVIDTILNRVDGKYWPNTVHDVIYQKNQFTSMWNGRADRCYVKEDIVELVKEELISRYNSECVFFRTNHYSQYGVPMFQVGHHYFSSYD